MDTQVNIVSAFSEEQASMLSGISKSQLSYWDRTGFFEPSFAEENRRVAFSRIYSFDDIVSLKVLNQLRNTHSVSLHHLRQVKEKLSQLRGANWGDVRLFVLNKKVHWVEPNTDVPQELLSQQYIVEEMSLLEVYRETKNAILQFRRGRDSTEVGKISQSRYVAHNSPVIAGTRISVASIRRYHDAGYSADEIVKEYPDLTEEDVEAALKYQGPRSAA